MIRYIARTPGRHAPRAQRIAAMHTYLCCWPALVRLQAEH